MLDVELEVTEVTVLL